jgi:CheY-like chemotaxis protein
MMETVHVLLVEDDSDDERLFRRYTRGFSLPVDVHSVTDGEKALAWLDREIILPALIALDLNLPRVTGRQLLRQVKCRPDLCRIPVAVISGSNWERERQFCEFFGADAYLHKPYSAQDLLEILSEVRANCSTLDPSNTGRIKH